MSPTRCQTAPPRARRDKEYSRLKETVSTMLHGKKQEQPFDLLKKDAFQSGVAPLARITLAHLSDSSRIQRENSSGDPATTSNPCLPRASRVSGACMARVASALSRETMSRSVPAAHNRPIQASDSSC